MPNYADGGDGSYDVMILLAKAVAAPMESVLIPRLELSATVLAVKVVESLRCSKSTWNEKRHFGLIQPSCLIAPRMLRDFSVLLLQKASQSYTKKLRLKSGIPDINR